MAVQIEREAKTLIDFQPILNHVLVEISYESTALALGSDKLNASEGVFKVVGYGNQTQSVELEDIIVLNHEYRNPVPFLISIPNNKKAHSYFYNRFKALNKEDATIVSKRGTKYQLIDYLCLPEYALFGVIKDGTETHKFITSKVKPNKEKEAKELFNI